MVRQGWLGGNLQVFRSAGLLLALSLVLFQSVRADNGFQARFALAKDYAEEWIKRAPKGPEWVLTSALDKNLDLLRARCGNFVDRRKAEVSGILTDWVYAAFEQIEATTARLMAEHLTLAELQRLSFGDPDAPTILEIVGESRESAFFDAYRRRIQRLKKEKWVTLRQRFSPKLQAIDPCLARNTKAFTRS